MQSLIITADDYGYHQHIDDAILEAARANLVTAVSCFANMPQKDLKPKVDKLVEVKQYVKEKYKKDLGIGLHFTFVSGEPLNKERNSLAFHSPTGSRFRTMPELQPRKVVISDLRKELWLQLDNLRNALDGRASIDHVSNHFNTCYLKKSFFECFVRTIADFDKSIPIRSPYRWTKFYPELKDEAKGRKELREIGWFSRPRRQLFTQLSFLCYTGRKKMALLAKKASGFGISHPPYIFPEFYGNPSFLMAQDYLESYGSHNTVEMIAHLSKTGRKYPEDRSISGLDEGYFENRKLEFELLTQRIQELCASHSLVMGSYRSFQT